MRSLSVRSVLTAFGLLAIPCGAIFADCHQVTYTWKTVNGNTCAVYTDCPTSPVCTGGFSTGLQNLGMTGNYTVQCKDYYNGVSDGKGGCTGGTFQPGSLSQKSFTAAPICSDKNCP